MRVVCCCVCCFPLCARHFPKIQDTQSDGNNRSDAPSSSTHPIHPSHTHNKSIFALCLCAEMCSRVCVPCAEIVAIRAVLKNTHENGNGISSSITQLQYECIKLNKLFLYVCECVCEYVRKMMNFYAGMHIARLANAIISHGVPCLVFILDQIYCLFNSIVVVLSRHYHLFYNRMIHQEQRCVCVFFKCE